MLGVRSGTGEKHIAGFFPALRRFTLHDRTPRQCRHKTYVNEKHKIKKVSFLAINGAWGNRWAVWPYSGVLTTVQPWMGAASPAPRLKCRHRPGMRNLGAAATQNRSAIGRNAGFSGAVIRKLE